VPVTKFEIAGHQPGPRASLLANETTLCESELHAEIPPTARGGPALTRDIAVPPSGVRDRGQKLQHRPPDLLAVRGRVERLSVPERIARVDGADRDSNLVRVPVRMVSAVGVERVQVMTVVSCVVAISATAITLRLTSFGQVLRAVADDRQRAQSVGIDVRKAMACAAALSGALAGVAGILVGLDRNIVPLMGFQGLLIGIVVAVVGGTSRLRGSVVAGMMIGVVQQLAVWKLPAEWQDLLLFVFLIMFLLARPKGAVADRAAQLEG
jgi:hypothetical protein